MLNRRVYVSRSGHYYPDLYCKIKIGNKWYILLVEVDEHQHTRNRRYKRENEKKRLIDLRVAMRLPMIVVRFNPDGCGKEHPNPWERDEQGIFRPVHRHIWDVRLETLVTTIRHLVTNPPDGLEQGLGIHLQFLYYDERNKYTLEESERPAVAGRSGSQTLEACSFTAKREDVRPLTEAVPDSWTLLHITSQYGNLEAVRFLIEKGVDLDTADEYGRTPLLIASQYGHHEVVRLLLKARVDKDTAENGGRTLFYIASENGHRDIVRLLLEARVD